MSDKYIDPVCDMEITAEEAAGKSEYKGQTYYFCSNAARVVRQRAEKYLGKAKQPTSTIKPSVNL